MDNLFNRRLSRYILAGGLSYTIELGFLLAIHRYTHASAEISTAIAFWIGLLTSFFLQKLFAFRDYKKTIHAITNQITSYALLVGFNYLFTIFVVAAFPSRLLILSRTLALVMTTVWNYFLYKRLIFRS